jgi:prophage regulatory protein
MSQSHLPATRLLRLAAILAPSGPIPVSRSTWWSGVKTGRFPQPVKLGPRITAWRAQDICALTEFGVTAEPPRNESEPVHRPLKGTPPDGRCSKRAESAARPTAKELKDG